MKIETKFWKKWEKADSIDKLKLVETLPFMGIFRLAGIETGSMINEYFEDLYIFMENKKVKK